MKKSVIIPSVLPIIVIIVVVTLYFLGVFDTEDKDSDKTELDTCKEKLSTCLQDYCSQPDIPFEYTGIYDNDLLNCEFHLGSCESFVCGPNVDESENFADTTVDHQCGTETYPTCDYDNDHDNHMCNMKNLVDCLDIELLNAGPSSRERIEASRCCARTQSQLVIDRWDYFDCSYYDMDWSTGYPNENERTCSELIQHINENEEDLSVIQSVLIAWRQAWLQQASCIEGLETNNCTMEYESFPAMTNDSDVSYISEEDAQSLLECIENADDFSPPVAIGSLGVTVDALVEIQDCVDNTPLTKEFKTLWNSYYYSRISDENCDRSLHNCFYNLDEEEALPMWGEEEAEEGEESGEEEEAEEGEESGGKEEAEEGEESGGKDGAL